MSEQATAGEGAAEPRKTVKCVVWDLDNTVWGGVIGEDGLGGLVLGGSPAGEAFTDFQDYLRDLGRRGLVLAVCSKNNPEDARLPFERHPEMRLGLQDFVAFDWGRRVAVTPALSVTVRLTE